MQGEKVIGRKLGLSILILLLLAGTQCTTKNAPAPPKDILGIGIGMKRADAQKRLEEIGVFEREERKQQQVWRLKNDLHYSNIIIAYDKSNEVSYLTAFADKSKERIRFTDIGDLSKAKKEVTEPHYKYTWEVAESEAKPAYMVVAYGTEPDFLSSCSLSKKFALEEEEDE